MVDLIFNVLHARIIYDVVRKILYIHSLMIRRNVFIWTFQPCGFTFFIFDVSIFFYKLSSVSGINLVPLYQSL